MENVQRVKPFHEALQVTVLASSPIECTWALRCCVQTSRLIR
jgi:hypothetical protein